jgi:transposase InsO family protein
MILGLIEEATDAGARFKPACRCINLDPRTVQRWRHRRDTGASLDDQRHGPRAKPANALSTAERAEIVRVATSPEFVDLPPSQIVPILADRGTFIASESTFYRVLRANELGAHRGPTRPRRHQRPMSVTATGPNQVWSWDITYVKSPINGQFYYLYLVVDVWSRKIVGAAVHDTELAEHASRLITEAARAYAVERASLVLHSDNGGPMKGSTMLATLQRLGIVPSFSRPRVSDDNAYSESLFRTLKYRPEYPRRGFASLAAARDWVDGFVHWYNELHLHSAIRFVTPADRHAGRERDVLAARTAVYEHARRTRPDRWSRSARDWTPIATVTLNRERRLAVA